MFWACARSCSRACVCVCEWACVCCRYDRNFAIFNGKNWMFFAGASEECGLLYSMWYEVVLCSRFVWSYLSVNEFQRANTSHAQFYPYYILGNFGETKSSYKTDYCGAASRESQQQQKCSKQWIKRIRRCDRWLNFSLLPVLLSYSLFSLFSSLHLREKRKKNVTEYKAISVIYSFKIHKKWIIYTSNAFVVT